MSMKARLFKKVACYCFVVIALLAASSASGEPIYRVRPGDKAGSGDGSSWANAMGVAEFREALKKGDQGEYWFTAGTYKPADVKDDNPRTKSFELKKGIALYGGFKGGE